MADDLEERLAKRARHDRVGWQGASLELERETPDDVHCATVDLEQFRNHQIGVGYQAKHVIRQPGVPGTKETKSLHHKKKKDGMVEMPVSDSNNNNKPEDRLAKYLKHAGLRRLRKELEIYK